MPLHRHARGAFTASLVTLLLALAVSSASANQLSISSTNVRSVWSALRFIVGSTTVTCHVTLEGSFHSSTFAKIEEALIGQITRATVGTCTGGSATVLSESLPWHVRYTGFTGTLPSITSVRARLIGFSLQYQPEGSLRCLLRSEAAHPLSTSFTVEAGVITELNVAVESEIPLQEEFGFCRFAGEGHFAGNGSVTVLGGTAAVRLTLIETRERVEPILSPSPIEFGRSEPEELTRRTVTLTAGTEALEIRRISVRSANYFAITDPNRCTGARLAERGTCAFKVIYAAPRESGRSVEDTVTVETSIRTLTDTVRGST